MDKKRIVNVCKTCGHDEFDTDFRIGDHTVHLTCRKCGWPEIATGDKAKTLLIAMQIFEADVQPKPVRDIIVDMMKEYTQRAKRNDSYTVCVGELYRMLYSMDVIDIEGLRDRYLKVMKKKPETIATNSDAIEYYKKKKKLQLEVIERVAKSL
jgi:predicted nucleic-acid-binding Zn-ribbon protein